MRTALLYSGRWYGSAAQHWIDNHRKHLILPNRADVFLVAALSDLCIGIPDPDVWRERLQHNVSDAFGSGVNAHAALIDEPNTTDLADRVRRVAAMAGHEQDATTHKISQLRAWFVQFEKLAAAEALRRRRSAADHDVIVRLRLDVPLQAPLPLHDFARSIAQHSRRVWAAGGITGTIGHRGMPRRRIMHDWLYITGSLGMRTLAGMTQAGIAFDGTARCFGLCPEEQVELQLRHAGIQLRPFTWASPGFGPLRIHRDPATCRPIPVAPGVHNSSMCMPAYCIPRLLPAREMRLQREQLLLGRAQHQRHIHSWSRTVGRSK